MLRKNIRELLKSNSDNSKITISLFNKDEGLIPAQLSDLDKEKKELELLRTQAQSGVNLNSFLANKYTDGNKFAIAQQNLYDNSKERIAAGISYEYHVFFPEDQYERAKRPPNSRIITNKIKHLETGDHYYYHFALSEFPVDKEMYFKIDLTEEIVTTQGVGVAPPGYPHNDNRLFYCLQNLSRILVEKKPNIPEYDYGVLQDNGFITEEGKLILDITTGVLVEKYFLKLDAKKKFNAMKYLNKEYKTEKEIEKVLQKDDAIDSTYPGEVPTVDGFPVIDELPVVDTNVIPQKYTTNIPDIPDIVDTLIDETPKKKSKKAKKNTNDLLKSELIRIKNLDKGTNTDKMFTRTIGLFKNTGKVYNIDNLTEAFDDLKKEGYGITIYKEKKGLNNFNYPLFIPYSTKRIAVLYLTTVSYGRTLSVTNASNTRGIKRFIDRMNQGMVSGMIDNATILRHVEDLGFKNIIANNSKSADTSNLDNESSKVSLIQSKTE